jgi:glycosyltransferase involved in cell wall biosynthesis
VRSDTLRVVHLVEAMGGSEHLWGKERAIEALMIAQRAGGVVAPALVTFSPSLLAKRATEDGFAAAVLDAGPHRLPVRAVARLLRRLRDDPPDVLHTHEYKANVAGRLIRPFLPRSTVVLSTSHGWIETSSRLAWYAALDRMTASLSDAVTVPSADMLARLPRAARAACVPNAIGDRAPADEAARRAARAVFGFREDAFVAGTFGRLSEEKGVLEFIAASNDARAAGVTWALAGAGPLEAAVREAPHVRFAGYLADAAEFADALDVFVQPSRTEGLSLALLEAMRAGRPIVATAVGATAVAARPDIEALIVPAGDAAALVAAVERLRADPSLRERLGTAARGRFEAEFRLEVQQEAVLAQYQLALARRRGRLEA